MAAPDYVPGRPGLRTKAYESPPWRPDSWFPERPAEVVDDGGNPAGGDLGYQGPDQGYALRLARDLRDKLVLAPREDPDDAISGGVAIGLRRASTFGRAPVMHDLTLAFELFGFFDEDPDPELLAHRRETFEELSNPHHYVEVRSLVSSIPEATLRMTPDQVRARRAEWRALLGL